MRFRWTAERADEDVCIDLRERLAPYTGELGAPDELELEPAMTAPRHERPDGPTRYQPRHLAP